MFSIGKKIGSGGEGSVYELLLDGKNTDKVVKFVKLKNYLECFIMFCLSHPNLLKADSIEINDMGQAKIVQEKQTCDLFSIPKLSRKAFIDIGWQIISGLNYLHSCGIIHGDLKPSNILYKDNNVKICDFSLSRFASLKIPGDKYYTSIYRPPELRASNNLSFASDIWALGCTLYELYYGSSYMTLREDKYFHITIDKELNSKDSDIKNLINSMFYDVDKRPTIKEIMSNNLFAKYSKKSKKNINIYSEEEHIYQIKKYCKDNNIDFDDFFLNKCLYGNSTYSEEHLKKEKELALRKFDIFNYLLK